MTYDIQFVDSIASSPTVRLNLYAAPWSAQVGTEFGTPELRRSAVTSLLADGDRYPAGAYGNRLLTLVLRVDAATDDDVAVQLQRLYRELDRPSNILLYRPGTTAPVFFRTFRCGPDSVVWDPFTKEVRVQVPAEPFALGLRETLPTATVYNDPAEGTTLNANPYFETDASGWTGSGGTIARSTAQFHEGVASLLLTPSGVATAAEVTLSSYVSVTAGQVMRVSAWVRCAVARNVQLGAVWSNGTTETGNSSTALPVAANTWTLLTFDTAAAPVGTTRCRMAVSLQGTPLASHLLHIDEARLRQAGGVGGMSFDVTSPKGDVEAPLFLSVDPSVVASRLVGARQSLIAVRRRGTPSAAPFALQAEAMTVGTDTTVQANNTAFSGAGSNWTRTTFATDAAMATRLQASVFPAAAGVDVRGTYRVFMRYRQSAQLGSPMRARLQWGASNGAAPLINGDAVALVQNDAGSVGPLVKYADLGLVQFPADYDPGHDGPSGVQLGAEGVYLAVQAERTSGSTSLDVDLLLFVPADDRLLTVRWPTAATPPTDLVVDSDAAAVYARNASGQVVTLPHPYLAGGAPMVSPGVTNRVYFLRDVGVESSTTDTNSAGDSITATTSITPYYWPRYLYTRPVAG